MINIMADFNMFMNVIMTAIIFIVLYSVYKRGLGIETMGNIRSIGGESEDEDEDAFDGK